MGVWAEWVPDASIARAAEILRLGKGAAFGLGEIEIG
jgi:hypothetical protein